MVAWIGWKDSKLCELLNHPKALEAAYEWEEGLQSNNCQTRPFCTYVGLDVDTVPATEENKISIFRQACQEC